MNLFFIGKPTQDALEYFVARGDRVFFVVDIQSQIDFSSYAGLYEEVYMVDFRDKSVFQDGLSQIDVQPNAVLSLFENSLLQKVWFGEYFGLPVPSESAVLASTDKFIMREHFQRFNDTITPHFSHVTSWADIKAFLATHDFPVVIKPNNLVKSLLVTKCGNRQACHQAYRNSKRIVRDTYRQEKIFRKPGFVVEEFLRGPSFSVDLFVDAFGNSTATPEPVDLVFNRDLGWEDNGNYSRKLPSQQPPEVQAELIAVAKEGVAALGLTNTAAHAELILTKQGPKIVEIGARVGGYRARMFAMALGIDLYQAMLNCALGLPVDLTPTKREHVAVYELFPQETGILVGVPGWEEVSQVPGVVYTSCKRRSGDPVGRAADGFRAVAVMIVHTADKATFETATKWIEANVSVEVMPSQSD